MKFCIDIVPETFLQKPDYWLELWKKSGVDSVQLLAAHVARLSSMEATAKAREIILGAGFECALISVPVGHPGGPMTEEQLKKHLRPGWRIRTGRGGNPEYGSAELTDKFINDVLAYCRDFASLGFDTMFMDDDLRSGNLSPMVCGCFCDDCIAEFSELENKKFTRESLLDSDEQTLIRWCIFQSKRVTKLMRGLGEIFPHPGIMIMNSGDERHGIAIKDIADIPGIQVRIGEEHFVDEATRTIGGRVENFSAVTGHLFRLGGKAETYSETTVCEYDGWTTTTPEHTLTKAYLALTAGVDNIDWMCTKHWGMMKHNYVSLRNYHAETCGKRAYPVHIARDGFAAQVSYYADTTATALGLPAAPVFCDEASGGEILVLPDRLYDKPEWREAAEKYKVCVRPSELKDAVKNSDIPHAESDAPLCLSWIPDRKRAALFNPLEEEQVAVVCGKSVRLAPGGVGILEL